LVSENKFMMTAQRQVILEELKKTNTHPTADEVYQLVRGRLPRISLGTVYRNLELLSENGMIRKLEWAGTQKRFDGELTAHYHIRCLNCSRIEDIHIEPLPALEETFRGSSDYEIMGYRFEIIGLCSQCKNEVPQWMKSKLEHSDNT